jgi:hypothetical protein
MALSVGRYNESLETKLEEEASAREHVVLGEPESISTATVFRTRGMQAFKAWFSSGTVEYTPCEADGTALPGASPVSMTTGVAVPTLSSFVLIDPSGSCTVDVY